MDQAAKSAWLAALRGGQYKQGFMSLRYRDRYCCLGVLCDVAGGGEWRADPDEDGAWDYVRDGKVSAVELPPDLAATLGIEKETERHLVRMNDSPTFGSDFGKIADYIEAEL